MVYYLASQSHVKVTSWTSVAFDSSCINVCVEWDTSHCSSGMWTKMTALESKLTLRGCHNHIHRVIGELMLVYKNDLEEQEEYRGIPDTVGNWITPPFKELWELLIHQRTWGMFWYKFNCFVVANIHVECLHITMSKGNSVCHTCITFQKRHILKAWEKYHFNKSRRKRYKKAHRR